MTSPPYRGGCLCGAIRYEINGPLTYLTFCHCSACRHVCGGGFLPFVGAATADFRWVSQTLPTSSEREAAPNVQITTLGTLRLSKEADRYFCTACGTPLAMSYKPERISLTAGSFDDKHEDALKEVMLRGSEAGSKETPGSGHIFTADKASWMDFDFWANKAPVHKQFPWD